MVEVLPPATARVVQELVKNGAPNSTLATDLIMSEQSIKWHLAHAMRISGTETRTALALWWIRRGQYASTEVETADERTVTRDVER